MTPREVEEYTALRATIRERGTQRVWLFLIGLLGWAAVAIATAALATMPVATLLPLLTLAGAFQAVFSVHTAVERIGRYVQVFLEEGHTGWEHAAMAFGQAFPTHGPDPLFAPVFAAATLLNFIPVLVAEPAQIELGVVGAAHLAFLVRVVLARRGASRQRASDLKRFQQLKAGDRV